MIDFISTLNGYLWGFPMIAFLFGAHIFTTAKTKCIQRNVLRGIKLSVTSPKGVKGELSPFASLATSLAGTLGTGNIIGVGTAVAMGGAGAVFWCWVTGILGMATQYCEVLLSVKYREKTDGGFRGGPMYFLKNGLGSKYLGLLYAFIASVSSLITGSVIQSNAIGAVMEDAFGGWNKSFIIGGYELSVLALMVGVVASLLASFVIFGGVKFIGKICSYLVPFMAVLFMGGCFLILFINRDVLFESIARIFCDAFSPRAAGGGFVGSSFIVALRYGVARGLFSNEAGLGTSSIIAATGKTPNPVRQALVSMTATFWDTVVMCFVTGIVIVSAIIKTDGSFGIIDGSTACYMAFSEIPFVGSGILIFSMAVFAFSTIIGLSYMGVSCASFVFGKKIELPYKILWTVGVFVAPMISLEVLWSVADLFNAFLAVPNVAGVFLMRGVIKSEDEKYLHNVDMQA